MKWFKNLKVHTKLALGFALMIVFMGIIGVSGYRSVFTIQTKLDEIFQVRLPGFDYILEIDRDLYQLLVAERSMIFTDPLSDEFQNLLNFYEENLRQSEERWGKYKELPLTSQERAVLPQYEEAREAWKALSRQVVEQTQKTGFENKQGTINLSIGVVRENFDAMRAHLDQLTEINLQIAEQAHQTAQQTYQATQMNLLIFTALGIGVGLGLALLISRGITNPLKQAVQISQQIADGNLPETIDVQSRDETGQLLLAMQQMTARIRQVLQETNTLYQSVQQGNLDARGNAEQFTGGWRELVSGVNHLLEAFVTPFKTTAETLEQVSRGDIPEKITEDYQGDFNLIKRSINRLIESVHETTRIAEEIAEGNLELQITPRSETDRLMNAMSTMLKKLQAVLSEVNELIQSVQKGRLDLRGSAENYSGGWSELIIGINELIGAFVSPINVTAEYIERISQGDLPEKISEEYQGDFNEIKNNLNRCLDVLSALISAMNTMYAEQKAGDYETRIDINQFSGIYKEVAHGYNEAVGLHVKNFLTILNILSQYAEGDFTPRLEQLPGKQVLANERMDLLRTNLRNLIDDTDMLVQAALAEQFTTRADISRHQGDFRKIVEGINNTLDLVVEKVFWYEQMLDSLPWPLSVTDMDMKWTFINKAAEQLTGLKRKQVIGQQCSNWNADICNTERCGIAMLRRGTPTSFLRQPGLDKDFQVDATYITNVQGERIGHIELVQEITATRRRKEYQDAEVQRLAQNLESLARGDLSFKIEIAEADQYTTEVRENFVQINTNLLQVKESISALVHEAGKLTEAAVQGDLSVRGHVDQFGGDYARIVQGINNTLDAVIEPLNMAAAYVDRISKGDLPEKITAEYYGDFNQIKENLNLLLDAMHEITHLADEMAQGHLAIEVKERSANDLLMRNLNQMLQRLNEVVVAVKEASTNVAYSSQQMSSSAQQMSEGATQQAASAEEASSSMEQMAANIRQNADNALQTEKIALKAARDAQESGRAVSETVSAMRTITDQITLIEDIAGQTRLLSLNATIEAARAAEHGRGFAVVAAEVRALAERSQVAANEIMTVASSSLQIAENAGELLKKLVPDIQKTAELVQEISAASREQYTGSEQINKAIQQLDQVIQQNASISEEMASTAESLESQAEQLQETMAFFEVNETITEPKQVKQQEKPHPFHQPTLKTHQTQGARKKLDNSKKKNLASRYVLGMQEQESTSQDEQDREFERY
ncbi:methyl-accepting chemotaxis sensory transducer [Candidatus Vecturithrix granuli]|uniref:Methyl-accepting chemotaxis sensory transducer n=1 Tax=Vecturithrix granuli TaxID=1499967 RepID=A0A0S6W9Q6_VECG1|nr:methyl-accepting chemotaxis sensory transducer [Candidatus Vecturithrix granuli]